MAKREIVAVLSGYREFQTFRDNKIKEFKKTKEFVSEKNFKLQWSHTFFILENVRYILIGRAVDVMGLEPDRVIVLESFWLTGSFAEKNETFILAHRRMARKQTKEA